MVFYPILKYFVIPVAVTVAVPVKVPKMIKERFAPFVLL